MGDRLQELTSLSGHTDRVWSVSWNPSGSALASCSGDKTVKIWQKEGEKFVCTNTLEGVHNRTVRCVAWSPCGRYLASASFDGTTAIWQYKEKDFECVATLEGHENEVKSVSWSASGTMLATCSRDKSVWIWDGEKDNEWECLSVLNGHSQDVKMVKWHPTDECLVSASYDDSLKVWTEQEDDWYCTETLAGHDSTVWTLAFDRTGKFVVSGGDDCKVVVWENVSHPDPEDKRTQWKSVCTLAGQHTRTVFSVDWSTKGVIASGGADDAICLFKENKEESMTSGERAFVRTCHMKKSHDSDLNCLAWHPSGELLASCSDDMTVKIWGYSSA